MKRPRIALWVKWHWHEARKYHVPTLTRYAIYVKHTSTWYTPAWLVRWAMRRVDRWHEEQYVDPLTEVNEVFHKAFDQPKSTTLIGKLHR